MKIKKIIVDVDNTLTLDSSAINYAEKLPNVAVINKLREFRNMGYKIVLFSARNMKTFYGDLSKINKITLPILIEWLEKNYVEYDEIIMGKPWCGDQGFYIDDKAIRPDEFLSMSEDEIIQLLCK